MSRRVSRFRVAVACSALALVGAACAAEDSVVAVDRTSKTSPTPAPPRELHCPSGKGETVSASYYVLPDAKGFDTPEDAALAVSDALDVATATYVESERRVFVVNAEDELVAVVQVLQLPGGWLAHGVEACAEPSLFKEPEN